MTASIALPAPSLRQRITRFSVATIVLAILAAGVPVALVLVLAHQIPDKSMRSIWPQLLAAAACIGGYALYVRKIERRDMSEFARQGAVPELVAGVIGGAAVFAAITGMLAAIGSYRIVGHNSWIAMLSPFALTVLVALSEEILFRGVLLRITERSTGTWGALAISSALFALAHVPNEGITMLAIAATVAAGVVFGAAYLVTRRLWLPTGLHFGWNFISEGVFSVDWLAGGMYGIEGSALTVAAMAVASVCLGRLAIRRGHVRARGRQEELQ
jgi:membrane protease YdiL (CAAX protease family)